MKALSITRPWADLILRGKDVENRTWKSNHRGPVLLHAAQSWAKDGVPFAAMASPDVLVGMPVFRDEHPTGIVGVADITAVCGNEMLPDSHDGPWAPCRCGPWAMAGQYHWRLANVRRLPRPVACRGTLGLWTPQDYVLDLVRAQLAEAAGR